MPLRGMLQQSVEQAPSNAMRRPAIASLTNIFRSAPCAFADVDECDRPHDLRSGQRDPELAASPLIEGGDVVQVLLILIGDGEAELRCVGSARSGRVRPPDAALHRG